MSNNIKLVYHNEDGQKVCEQAESAIRSISQNIQFNFDEICLSQNQLQNPDDSVFDNLKCGDALLFCGFDQGAKEDASFLLTMQKKFNLYATAQHYQNLTLVYDGFGGIYHGKKGFDTNKTFGREAYDVASYGELEIERTARIAYEIADSGSRKLLLADRADALATSALWRKAVVDINEDYPFVNVDCNYVESVLLDILNLTHDNTNTSSLNEYMVQNAYDNGVILTSNMYGIILDTVCKSRLNFLYATFAGDTPFAGFVCTKNTPIEAYKNILTFSFGTSC